MNIRFYSRDYDFLGMADEATVIFTGRWHTYGQFEIYLDQMEPYIQKGNRIIWDRDNRKNGIIEYINVADASYSRLMLWAMASATPKS